MKPGILVTAKAPVAGQAKTRLAVDVGARPAADLAAAALLDTLEAAEAAFPSGRRVLALSGDLSRAERSAAIEARLSGWQVVDQRGNGFGSRLAGAHQDAARLLGGPVVQIGMDTPQVDPGQLRLVAADLLAGGCDAVLGPATDGGWWTLGLTDPKFANGLSAVPMSTAKTERATRVVLTNSGAQVRDTMTLTDVDTLVDADRVAGEAPETRFGRAWRRLRATTTCSPAELFDEALAGVPCVVHGLPQGPTPMPVTTWQGDRDAVDDLVIAKCTGPSLDVGCGPGRMTQGLAMRGSAALGIDVAPRAVLQTRARGAQAIRRDVFEALPAEGRWDSVLLVDGNVGIGGDPARLLARVRQLLSREGQAVVELAAPGTGVATHQLHLSVGGRRSTTFGWSVVGVDALEALATSASLKALWVISRSGRWFAGLGSLR